MADRFEVGDIIKMKKPHPCGSHEWEVLRVGADFRLKCMGCGHQIMIPRKQVEKSGQVSEQQEKEAIAARLRQEQRRKDLEEQVRREMIERGELPPDNK